MYDSFVFGAMPAAKTHAQMAALNYCYRPDDFKIIFSCFFFKNRPEVENWTEKRILRIFLSTIWDNRGTSVLQLPHQFVGSFINRLHCLFDFVPVYNDAGNLTGLLSLKTLDFYIDLEQLGACLNLQFEFAGVLNFKRLSFAAFPSKPGILVLGDSLFGAYTTDVGFMNSVPSAGGSSGSDNSVITIFFPAFIFFDMPRATKLLFQDPATVSMISIINFHHDLF
jgi:hypothetical protein